MADKSRIEWTDATWNPITGCTVLSPGCKHCYAMGLAGGRLHQHPSRAGLTVMTKAGPVWTGEVRFNPGWLTQPLRLPKSRMIFVCAHGDLFHPDVPDSWIDQTFAVMALAPWHIYQVLTKRSGRMLAYCSDPETPARIASAAEGIARTLTPSSAAGRAVFARFTFGAIWRRAGAAGVAPVWPMPHVWLGVSAEDQERFDQRVPELGLTPAAVRFISFEPMLGEISAIRELLTGRFHWAIAGMESGPRARPGRAAWARKIRDHCSWAGVPFLFKQWGEYLPEGQFDRDGLQWAPGSSDARVHWWEEVPPDAPVPDDACAVRIGKHQAGRSLDGVIHHAFPKGQELARVA